MYSVLIDLLDQYLQKKHNKYNNQENNISLCHLFMQRPPDAELMTKKGILKLKFAVLRIL